MALHMLAAALRFIVRAFETLESDETPLGRPLADDVRALEALADATLQGAVAPSGPELAQSAQAFETLHEALEEKAGSEDVDDIDAPDRRRLYDLAVRLAFLGHPDFQGWPVHHEVRAFLFHLYRNRIDSGEPWDALAALMPAIVEEKASFAVRCLRLLESGPLFEAGVRWMFEVRMAYPALRSTVDKVQAQLQLPNPRVSPDPAFLPGQRWALTALIFPTVSEDDRWDLNERMGGAGCQLLLAELWDVHDAESARDVLRWLLEKGHRTSIREGYGRIDQGQPVDDPALAHLAVSRKAYEATSALAWDACRAIRVARQAHTAGYLEGPEAWACILAAARGLRTTYGSWQEMVEGFELGQAFYAEGWAYADMTAQAAEAMGPVWAEVPFSIEPAAFDLDPEQLAASEARRTPRPRNHPVERPKAGFLKKYGQGLAWVVTSIWCGVVGFLAQRGQGPGPWLYRWQVENLGLEDDGLTAVAILIVPLIVFSLILRMTTGRYLEDPRRYLPKWLRIAGLGLIIMGATLVVVISQIVTKQTLDGPILTAGGVGLAAGAAVWGFSAWWHGRRKL